MLSIRCIAILAGAFFMSASASHLRPISAAEYSCDADELCAKLFPDGARPCCNFQHRICEARDSPNAITAACRSGGGGAAPAAPAPPAPQAPAAPAGKACGAMVCAANQVCGTFTGSCEKISPACTEGQVQSRWTGDFQACIDPGQCGVAVANQDPGYVPSNWRC